MKTLLINSPNDFSQKVLLFQPDTVPKSLALGTAGGASIVLERQHHALADHVLRLADFKIEHGEVLHRQCLSTLSIAHPHHFAAIRSRAASEGFSPNMTYIYEAVTSFGPNEFFLPNSEAFAKRIRAGTLPLSWYESFSGIEQALRYMVSYIDSVIDAATFLAIWKWSETMEGSVFSRAIQQRLLVWKKQKELEQQNAE